MTNQIFKLTIFQVASWVSEFNFFVWWPCYASVQNWNITKADRMQFQRVVE